MEESGTRKVDIPAEDKDRAISCPLHLLNDKVNFVAETVWSNIRWACFGNDDSEFSVMRRRQQEGLYCLGFPNRKNYLAIISLVGHKHLKQMDEE